MDKIFSARLDEMVVRRIAELAHRLGTTKKSVIERAVTAYAKQVDQETSGFLEESFGAWQRRESPGRTADRAREVFEKSMKRRHL